jgi:transcriptional regulator with XRE-family HTH domain
MNPTTINLRDLKEKRLQRHWSQEQLAEISGLSIRTIQRIENGKNAGLESLDAIFEIDIINSDKKKEIAQIRTEEAYIQNIKGFYKLLAIAILNLIAPVILAINDTSNWGAFF